MWGKASKPPLFGASSAGGKPLECSTDVLDVKLVDGRKATAHIFVYPGNPGLPEYYRVFAQSLAEEAQARVTVVGHAGHTRSDDMHPVYPLCEQVCHKFAALDELAVDADVPIAVVGHSIGAHMALACLSPSASHNNGWRRRLRSVVCATPFLQTNKRSTLQRTLDALVRFWPLHLLAALLGDLLRLLPLAIRSWVLRNAGTTTGMAPHAAYITSTDMLRSSMVLNYVGMGHSEFDDLAAVDAAARWAPVVEKQADVDVSFMFATSDHWGPTWQRDELRDAMPRTRFATFDIDKKHGIKHDFPTSEFGSRFFAKKVAEEVGRALAATAHPIK